MVAPSAVVNDRRPMRSPAIIAGRMETVDDEIARARRERWWRSSFIILATIYVGRVMADYSAPRE